MSKRLFDFFSSIFGLLLLSPLFIVIALWIKLDSKGPVFFRQLRVGQYGQLFSIHKFRTMRINSEKMGQLTIGFDNRVTRSGQFLRKCKLDELPQLVDVLRGKMSLVGPRPEVPEFMEFYADDVKKVVLSVKPGITDRASIEMVDENQILSQYSNPRDAYINKILPLKQKYYVDYAKKHNITLDVLLIFKTIKKIILR